MMNSTAVKLVLLLLLPILVTTWRFRRKYIYSNHSRFYIYILVPKMQHSKIATVKLFPRSNHKLRKSIVRLHNKYRASVEPPASNMLRMVKMKTIREGFI